MLVDGNTTTIIANTHAAIRQDSYIDACGETSNGLVDRVISNFFNKVVHTIITGATNIHSRTLTNRL
ncbi:hypothetical protein D3C79_945070 [compost metagenome]